ncbi:MAG: ABC transporter substrate-binding protein, partial [Armatimonadetes bacterium]|nr:ABC transporter substrate-binding protein [Armatimonadota bacterium]
MHHRLIRIVVVPAVLLVLSLLSAPGAGAPKSSWDAKSCGRVGGTLVFGQAGDAVTLDPHDANDGFSINVSSNMFDTLVRFRADSFLVEPSLAESWTASPDGRVWTFKLRRGIKFHDGT